MSRSSLIHTSKALTNDKPAITDKPIARVRLWHKIRHAGKIAGFNAVETALVLFYTSTAKETPTWCKSVIYGALGYFISLIDGIPDLTPILGYTDDVAVMMAAMATIAQHITPEIRTKALARTETFLGPKQAEGNEAGNTYTSETESSDSIN